MKNWIVSICVLAVSAGAFAQLGERELKAYKRDTELSGVRDSVGKTESRDKYQELEISTLQNEDETEGFQLRMYVELVDKAKKSYLVKAMAKQPSGLDSEYTGEDTWEFKMMWGELERVKVNAYVVQYGILDDDGNFTELAVEMDDVKTLEELLARESVPFANKLDLRHSYKYEHPDDGETESTFRRAKVVKMK